MPNTPRFPWFKRDTSTKQIEQEIARLRELMLASCDRILVTERVRFEQADE